MPPGGGYRRFHLDRILPARIAGIILLGFLLQRAVCDYVKILPCG
jgi:hypothetical protein